MLRHTNEEVKLLSCYGPRFQLGPTLNSFSLQPFAKYFNKRIEKNGYWYVGPLLKQITQIFQDKLFGNSFFSVWPLHVGYETSDYCL